MHFWSDLERHSDLLACTTEDGVSVRYGELIRLADSAGFHAVQRQLVLLEMTNELSAIAAYVGALRAGHAIILVNSTNNLAVDNLIERFRPTFHWRDGGLIQGGETSKIDLHADLKIMLATSGSTGAGKLVRLSADAIHANAASIARYLDIQPADRAITSLPPAYSYGLSVINSHLLSGASLVLSNRSVVDPVFRTLMDDASATSIACVPYSIDLLDRTGFFAKPPPSLRTITQAGGRLSPEKVARIGQAAGEADVKFIVMYGQTEATARIAWLPPRVRDAHPDAIGQAIPGGTLSLRDLETGLPASRRGELIYSGPNVMMGYAESPGDLCKGSELDELATGDIAELIDDGIFRIVGRKNRFAKLFGQRISFDDIEADLSRAGVASVVTGTDERIVVAVRSGEKGVTAEELAARYKIPEGRIAILRLDDFPRLPNGKLDFQKILALATPGADEKHGHPFEAYKRLLIKINGGRRPSPDLSFDELRGDSLSFVEASILLEQALGDLPAEWQTLPFSELELLVESAAPWSPRGSRFVVAPDILVRLIAVFMIIIGHGLGDSNTFLKGGSDVLLLVAGYSAARYNGRRLVESADLSVLTDNLRRIAPPLYLVLIVYSVLANPLPWYYWAFVQNYFDDQYIPFYWFVSAWVQCVAFVAAIFLLRPVRDRFRNAPVQTSLFLLGAAVALKFSAYLWGNPGDLRFRQFDQVLCFFLAGWLIFVAKRGRSAIVAMVVAGLCSLSAWGAANSHPYLIVAAGAYLAFGKKLPLPPLLSAPVQSIALASFYIYLFGAVPTLLLWRYGVGGQIPPALTVVHFVATIVLGVTAWWAMRWGQDRFTSYRRRALAA